MSAPDVIARIEQTLDAAAAEARALLAAGRPPAAAERQQVAAIRAHAAADTAALAREALLAAARRVMTAREDLRQAAARARDATEERQRVAAEQVRAAIDAAPTWEGIEQAVAAAVAHGDGAVLRAWREVGLPLLRARDRRALSIPYEAGSGVGPSMAAGLRLPRLEQEIVAAEGALIAALGAARTTLAAAERDYADLGEALEALARRRGAQPSDVVPGEPGALSVPAPRVRCVTTPDGSRVWEVASAV